MSSGARNAAAASIGCLCLALAACGNYSDQDIPYLEAVPTQLALTLPQAGEAACAHPSDLAARAQSDGDAINSGIERAVALADLILESSPSSRVESSPTESARTWGPFDDKAHAGFEIQIAMTEDQTTLTFSITVEERPKGGAFVDTLDGALTGATAAAGTGALTLHFDNLRALGINQPSDPKEPMTVTYDFTADPKLITLTIEAGDSFGSLPGFAYAWSGYADGHDEFDYEFVNASGGTLVIPALFSALGAGTATVTYTPATGAPSQISECWDDAFCISYLDDPTDATLNCSSSPCDLGAQSACVNVQ